MNFLELRTVKAKFANNDTEYSYFVPKGDEPMVGDYLITSTSRAVFEDMGDGYGAATVRGSLSAAKIARIVQVETTPNPKATKFYLQLLSTAVLRDRHAENKTMLLMAEKRRHAKSQLDKMLSERLEIDRYRELAKGNKEADRLLAILEGRA